MLISISLFCIKISYELKPQIHQVSQAPRFLFKAALRMYFRQIWKLSLISGSEMNEVGVRNVFFKTITRSN